MVVMVTLMILLSLSTLGELASGGCRFSIHNPFPLRLEQKTLRGGKG